VTKKASVKKAVAKWKPVVKEAPAAKRKRAAPGKVVSVSTEAAQ